MTLIERIKADQLDARKGREKVRATILTTLIGEADMIGKNAGNRPPTDDEVLKCIRSFLKGINEILTTTFDTALTEIEEKSILETYIPQQMNDVDLQDTIHSIIIKHGYNSIKDMGKIMTNLRINYAGLYDGKKAADFVKISLHV